MDIVKRKSRCNDQADSMLFLGVAALLLLGSICSGMVHTCSLDDGVLTMTNGCHHTMPWDNNDDHAKAHIYLSCLGCMLCCLTLALISLFVGMTDVGLPCRHGLIKAYGHPCGEHPSPFQLRAPPSPA